MSQSFISVTSICSVLGALPAVLSSPLTDSASFVFRQSSEEGHGKAREGEEDKGERTSLVLCFKRGLSRSTTSKLQLLLQQGKKKGEGGRYFRGAMVVGYVLLCVCVCGCFSFRI